MIDPSVFKILALVGFQGEEDHISITVTSSCGFNSIKVIETDCVGNPAHGFTYIFKVVKDAREEASHFVGVAKEYGIQAYLRA